MEVLYCISADSNDCVLGSGVGAGLVTGAVVGAGFGIFSLQELKIRINSPKMRSDFFILMGFSWNLSVNQF